MVYCANAPRNKNKILDLHGGAHTEHNNTQHKTQNAEAGNFTQDPGKGRRISHTSYKKQQNNNAEIFTYQFTKLFHNASPPCKLQTLPGAGA